MSNHRIAARYTKSLIALAVERGELEAVHSDMQLLDKAVQSRDFYLLMKSPIVPADKKLAVVKALFEGKVSALTLGYLQLLIRKGREAYLPEVAREFFNQYKAIRRITSVRIISAGPLSEAVLEQIKERIRTSGLATENLEITTHIDPSLVGGFILEFDDKRYDASIASRLADLRAEYSKNQYVREF
ncbi:MAG: ATP synthase F1 subunit delta [Saprospiraceae bacterium]|nr:ATP synthase F1 subunit delta [Saprospiraceae bacterium]MDW8230072.1 ATP synthase F1 subunit delta [Saprospiraceae bacterium]